jgi:hypothetical protein
MPVGRDTSHRVDPERCIVEQYVEPVVLSFDTLSQVVNLGQ